MNQQKELSFEEALERLEIILGEMEGEELPLKSLIAHYAEGIELSNKCLAELDTAETQMDVILKESGGKLREVPLSLEENEIC